MKTIAVCNQKGGVGKSTSTFHLARAAHCAGLRTLVVDMDPQGNVSTALTRDLLVDGQAGTADALSTRSAFTLQSVLVPSVWDMVMLAPSGGDMLAGVRDELVGVQAGREQRLRLALEPLDNTYDLAFIDCPPSLDQLSINALTAADAVLVVTQAKLWSSSGLAHLLDTIHQVRDYYNPDLKIAGILVNLHDTHTVSAKRWLEELTTACTTRQLPLLSPPIPRRVVIADSAEAACGLDQWTPPHADLHRIYTTHLHTLLHTLEASTNGQVAS